MSNQGQGSLHHGSISFKYQNKIIVLKITRPSIVTRFCMFCAYTRPGYKVSVYMTIGPLVFHFYREFKILNS